MKFSKNPFKTAQDAVDWMVDHETTIAENAKAYWASKINH
jgi:hypothetical protein